MQITLPTMSAEFILALLEKLEEPITKIRIGMNKQYGGTQKFDEGREVCSIVQTIYTWRGEDTEKIKSFSEWKYTDEMRFELGPSKYLIVNEHMTHIDMYGITQLPDFKTIPGQPPRKITLHF